MTPTASILSVYRGRIERRQGRTRFSADEVLGILAILEAVTQERDAAPQWKTTPDALGWWIWTSGTVAKKRGLLEITTDTVLKAFQIAAEDEGPWFGPIPSPDTYRRVGDQ